MSKYEDSFVFQEDPLETRYIQRVRDADGVSLTGVILNVELESALTLDHHARSNSRD
jgi:hypothetical protein